jgi:uncharacterized repeat protein (TIGR03803 family)
MKAHLACLLPGTVATTLIVCAAAPPTALAQPPEGTYRQVHSFDGMLYGTTLENAFGGAGTVFRLEADGSVTNLWDLDGYNGGPAYPWGRLLQASDGLPYGTSISGADLDWGAIFSVAPDGSGHRLLHSFSGSDGCGPQGGLIEASDGHLYGTSPGGPHDDGVVYRIDRDGSNFTLVHPFSERRDGSDPHGELVETSPGVFVGTAQKGGKAFVGTVFQMLATGEVTVLHQFTDYLTGRYWDGYFPMTTLTLVDGNTVFGVTLVGGARFAGTVFKLSAP